MLHALGTKPCESNMEYTSVHAAKLCTVNSKLHDPSTIYIDSILLLSVRIIVMQLTNAVGSTILCVL